VLFTAYSETARADISAVRARGGKQIKYQGRTWQEIMIQTTRGAPDYITEDCLANGQPKPKPVLTRGLTITAAAPSVSVGTGPDWLKVASVSIGINDGGNINPGCDGGQPKYLNTILAGKGRGHYRLDFVRGAFGYDGDGYNFDWNSESDAWGGGRVPVFFNLDESRSLPCCQSIELGDSDCRQFQPADGGGLVIYRHGGWPTQSEAEAANVNSSVGFYWDGSSEVAIGYSGWGNTSQGNETFCCKMSPQIGSITFDICKKCEVLPPET
jgi:hypothetical protein